MKIKLKGGSLSKTCLIQDLNLYDGKQFVRKSVSLTQNREYGYQRWYSQLKRLQRYEQMVPGLFPNLLKYGVKGETAYFDIEYIEDSVNAQEYLYKERSTSKIEIFFDHLKANMRRLHDIKLASCSQAIELYIWEEVNQKLNDSISSIKFSKFLQYDTINFNGQEVSSFVRVIDDFKRMLIKYYIDIEETYSHGNLTLENIIYVPYQERVVFIDPYEENIIDSKLADYSQLLQSSHSKYELLNKSCPSLLGNRVDILFERNFGIEYFNTVLDNYLNLSLSVDQYMVVALLEISQFIRMLPFKKEIDEHKMILFYSLASKLFHDLQETI